MRRRLNSVRRLWDGIRDISEVRDVFTDEIVASQKYDVDHFIPWSFVMNDARALATKRMVAEAEALSADAIVAVRYSSASVMQSAAEVMAYGTAVRFRADI